jgi:hypothetical protein
VDGGLVYLRIRTRRADNERDGFGNTGFLERFWRSADLLAKKSLKRFGAGEAAAVP